MNQASLYRSLSNNGNIYHYYSANKNEGLPKHEHDASHLIICTSGSCLIRKENKELILDNNSKPINLVANEWHEIESLEENTEFITVFKIQSL